MTFHEDIRSQLQAMLASQRPAESVLNSSLRLLAKYRSALIQNTLVGENGVKVMAGPFAGMQFLAQSSEGCHIPKLLGCYEEELHDVFLALPRSGYEVVLNIGCAEGYYAVGVKRLLPDAEVRAYDTDPVAQKACAALAKLNDVALEIGPEFKPEDFDQFAGRKVLILCDIEGAEIGLLDPVKAPALAGMDMVVELHPVGGGHAASVVPPRFAATHDIEIRHSRGHDPALPEWLQRLGHLDQLLAQWEWRSAPTPWAIMRAKA